MRESDGTFRLKAEATYSADSSRQVASGFSRKIPDAQTARSLMWEHAGLFRTAGGLRTALAAFGGMLVLNGLPRLRHPVFDTPDFDLASRNRFFLCIRSTDERFDLDRTNAWLRGLAPLRVVATPAEEEQ
jgi:hypothetical protein